jgi:hypothetical protein
LGLILFGVGIVAFDRQFRRVKKYVASHEKARRKPAE